MSVLGPLENNVRIIFTINFKIPAQYDKSDGDAMIIDTLPAGLSLYTGSNNLNSVSINNTALPSTGFSHGGTTSLIYTIYSSEINPYNNIVLNIDTFISNSSLITRDTDLINSSTMFFKNAKDNKYESTGGSYIFQLTGIDNQYLLS